MVEETTEVSGSSTDTEQSEDVAVDTNQQETQSSSVESEKETEETLLSVVQDALEPEKEEPEVSDEVASQATEEIKEEVVEASEETKVETEEDVPFNKHPRFQQLIKERNEYKEDATQQRNIQKFMRENSLTPDEAAQGFRIMALLKNNPMQAYNELKPIYENIAQLSGKVIPDDIQSKVNDGYMDEDAASELAQLRAKANHNENRVKQLNQSQQQQAQRQYANSIANVASSWEQKTKQQDPDYDLKAEMLSDRVSVLVNQKGSPKTPDQAIQVMNEAYSDVNKRFERLTPVKKPINAPSGQKLSGSPMSEPQSMMEAVEQALRKA